MKNFKRFLWLVIFAIAGYLGYNYFIGDGSKSDAPKTDTTNIQAAKDTLYKGTVIDTTKKDSTKGKRTYP